jgi:hypothetical protein
MEKKIKLKAMKDFKEVAPDLASTFFLCHEGAKALSIAKQKQIKEASLYLFVDLCLCDKFIFRNFILKENSNKKWYTNIPF